MPIFKIHHITRYEYDRPVKESVNEIKIYPLQCATQEVLQHDLSITGNPEVQTFMDYWGNKTGAFNLLAAHKLLKIESKLLVRTTATSQLQLNFHSGFEQLRDELNESLLLIEMARTSAIKTQDVVGNIQQTICQPGRSIAAVTEACSEYIYRNFKYIKGITNIETTVDEIIAHRAGVCQDFAHLMLQILRSCQIPARYVSGYICPNKDGLRGEGATHAWVEVYVPGTGWAGIDPTNNVWVTNKHVKLAVGRDFRDCTPVKGTFKGPAKQTLSVFVAVGYEDGYVFEELNNVHLQGQQVVEFEDSGSGQQ
jgi:transglutaminase-like putative cysteine protease